MNGAGDQFFAGTAFAGYQHGGIEVGYATNELINVLHLRTGPDHPVATATMLQLLLCGLELPLE